MTNQYSRQTFNLKSSNGGASIRNVFPKMRMRLIATTVLVSLGVVGLSPASESATAAPAQKSWSAEVIGWKTQQTRLSPNQKSAVKALVRKSKKAASSGKCIGLHAPSASKREKALLTRRAKATCTELKGQAAWVKTEVVLSATKNSSKHGRVKIRLVSGSKANATAETSAAQCKIQSSGSGWNSVGFPVTARFGGGQKWAPLPSRGAIKALVIGVDFPNYPGQTPPASYVEEATNKTSEFFYAMSYGSVTFNYTVLPEYVRMSKNAEDYGIGSWGSGDYELYYREALSRAAAEFEIGGYDVAYVMASPETPASAITPGPAFPWPENTADGIVPLGTATGGMPLGENAFRWMAHETGHLFGWVDLYDVSGTVNPGGSRHTRFGWWDIMGMNWETFSLEINGWFRFQLGWIADSEVLCLQGEKLQQVDVAVSNLSSSQPRRLVVVRTGPQKVVVIERRSITSYAPMSGNSALEGVLVYQVDGAINFQKAPISIARKNGLSIDDSLSFAALKPGDSVLVDGLEISVGSEDSNQSLVSIRK